MVKRPTSELYGVRVELDFRFVDPNGGRHHLLAAGPYLKCLEHAGTIERAKVGDALEALSHARTCDRLRVAWQRLMLADDRAVGPILRGLPRPLAAYLASQTQRHAARLDEALDPATDHRDRRRWHNTGWRAAPSLAARYQAAGVEAGVAFIAMRRGVDPEDVQAAADDKHSPVGAALRDHAFNKRVQLLDIGLRQTVTDDFPYEPL